MSNPNLSREQFEAERKIERDLMPFGFSDEAPMYHGSNASFEVGDVISPPAERGEIGHAATSADEAVYFTEDPNVARQYGQNLYEVEYPRHTKLNPHASDPEWEGRGKGEVVAAQGRLRVRRKR